MTFSSKSIIMASLCCLFITGCGLNGPDSTLLKGLEAYKEQDFYSAISHLQTYVEKWPKHEKIPLALFYLGDSYMKDNKLEQAEIYFRRYLNESPQHTFIHRVRLSMGIVLEDKSRRLESKDKPEEALQAWQESRKFFDLVRREKNPDYVVLADQATRYLAASERVHGNTDAALKIFEERANQPNANFAMWYDSEFNCAEIHIKGGDYDSARVCLEEICSVTSLPFEYSLQAFMKLADTYRREDNTSKAVQVYTDLYERYKDGDMWVAQRSEVISNRLIADTLLDTKQPQDASPYLELVYEKCGVIFNSTGTTAERAAWAGLNMADIKIIQNATEEAKSILYDIMLNQGNTRGAMTANVMLSRIKRIEAGETPGATVESVIPQIEKLPTAPANPTEG
jgi:tetratricopeptide (TPR) repeat protein